MSSQADPLRTAPEQQEQPVNPDRQAPAGDLPSHVGRYRVERLLGEGGFRRVYLTYDDQLQRRVAVKVPHRRLVGRPEDAGRSRAEVARRAGVPASAIRNWEGDRGFPGMHAFRRLAGALGVTLERLAEGVEDPGEDEAVAAQQEARRRRKRKGR
jgi:serine/threonine protein kinase